MAAHLSQGSSGLLVLWRWFLWTRGQRPDAGFCPMAGPWSPLGVGLQMATLGCLAPHAHSTTSPSDCWAPCWGVRSKKFKFLCATVAVVSAFQLSDFILFNYLVLWFHILVCVSSMHSIWILQGHYCHGEGSAGASTKCLLVALISLIYLLARSCSLGTECLC